MTGSTRELKVNAYTDIDVKEVAAQHSSIISNMNEDMGAKDGKIEQLFIELNKLKCAQLPKYGQVLYDKVELEEELVE